MRILRPYLALGFALFAETAVPAADSAAPPRPEAASDESPLSPAGSPPGIAPDAQEAGAQAEAGPDAYDDIKSLRTPSPAWEDPTPVARVGAETVTAGDLHYALDNGRATDRSQAPDSLKRSLLEKVINQRLLVQEAHRRGYERGADVVDHAQRLEDQLAGEELRRRIYSGQIDITEAEIKELYERYHYTMRVRYLHVDQRELALDLLRRARAGEDFAELAERYSDEQKDAKPGGDLGEVVAEGIFIEFEDAVFPLEPGGLTEVIKGKGEHYYIFKLESKARDRTPPLSLDKMRPALAERVRRREAGAVYYRWQLSMFEKYNMEINEENFRIFAHRMRDQIATLEAVNAVHKDSLPQQWIFSGWPAEVINLELARFGDNRLIVGEFNKSYRDQRFCPTCLWRDSDVQFRQFIRGFAFEKIIELEKRAIRAEKLPAIKTEVERRKGDYMAQAILREAHVPPENIGEEEARAFWEKHKLEFKVPTKGKARRIVVESEAQARDIVKRLEGGADFAALAEQFSKDETTNWRGGETDLFWPGTLSGMPDIALQHEVGTLIPPFKSQAGWEVVLLIEKIPPGLQTFEQASGTIKARLARERTEANVDALLAELRRSAPVTVDEAALAQLPLRS